MPFKCYAASGDNALENEADGGMETHAFDCSSGEVRQSGALVVGGNRRGEFPSLFGGKEFLLDLFFDTWVPCDLDY